MVQAIFKYMELKCNCSQKCIKTAEEILKEIKSLHKPCFKCSPIKIKKFTPLVNQVNLSSIDHQYGRCVCNRRHLDLAMAHVLKIMIEEGLENEKSTLRKAAVPLITPAYPLKYDPFLNKNSLIILTPHMDNKTANRILNEVEEVKGVLKGEIGKKVGIKDSNSTAYVYQLLAGCDVRCDILKSPFGPICIHKNQSEIHVEISRSTSSKINSINSFLKKNDYPTDFNVLDATCGPGTLGIFCLKAGVGKVVFNDLWEPAVNMTTINIECNGFKVDFLGEKYENGIISSGMNFEVYNQDLRKLNTVLDEKFDLCIIDPFPGTDPEEFIKAASKLSREILII